MSLWLSPQASANSLWVMQKRSGTLLLHRLGARHRIWRGFSSRASRSTGLAHCCAFSTTRTNASPVFTLPAARVKGLRRQSWNPYYVPRACAPDSIPNPTSIRSGTGAHRQQADWTGDVRLPGGADAGAVETFGTLHSSLGKPTTYELATALGFLCFAEEEVDMAVVRWDWVGDWTQPMSSRHASL